MGLCDAVVKLTPAQPGEFTHRFWPLLVAFFVLSERVYRNPFVSFFVRLIFLFLKH